MKTWRIFKRQKKSGNGTTSKQHIYLLLVWWFRWPLFFVATAATLCLWHIHTAGAMKVAWWAVSGPYLAFILSCCPVVKIGVTGNMENRLSDIDRSSPGTTVKLLWPQLPRAYQLEQFLHSSLSWFSVPWHGSGSTEYFHSIVIFPAAITILLVWAIYVFFKLIIALAILAAIMLLSSGA